VAVRIFFGRLESWLIPFACKPETCRRISMRERTRVIAAAAAVTAALAVGGGAALASMTGAKPHSTNATHAKSVSASQERQHGHDAIVAAVAAQLHVSTTLVSAALRPIFAAGHADPTSSTFAAAARALGVSTQQLANALTHAKLSLAPDPQSSQKPGGTKSMPGSKSAEERQGHNAIVAAVATQLHVSPVRVSAALRPIFAAGHADPTSPSFAAAARALGVSTHQLADALTHAKLSLAQDAQGS
jgi:hypothetical protein